MIGLKYYETRSVQSWRTRLEYTIGIGDRAPDLEKVSIFDFVFMAQMSR